MDNIILFECPHCDELIAVSESELNCGIFRHAVFKNNFTQINPHESKQNCDKYVSEGLVYGCAKPFKIKRVSCDINEYRIECCDYI